MADSPPSTGGSVRSPRAAAPYRKLLPWLVVLVFAAVGYLSVLPPHPLSTAAADDRFSAQRAVAHVAAIATAPHPVGSAAIAEVRAYILTELDRLGVEVEQQVTTAPDYYGGGEPVQVVNLVARIPGTASTKAVALMGHYDTVPATSGANDDTAAVATLLETARALLAGQPLRNDVVLLFTDGEEPAPRYGATSFVNQHPAFRDLGLIVNFEATGGSGASILVETSGPEAWLVEGLAAADCHPAAFSFLTDLARRLGDIGTDFDAFRRAGVPGLHFAYLHGSPIYHTEADDLTALGRGSLQHHGDHALGIARHFGDLDLGEPHPVDRAVYFPVRPFFFHYPAGWAIPLALLAVVVYALGALRRRSQAGLSPAAVLRSAGRAVGAGLLAALLGTVLWLGIVALRSTPQVVESYVYFGCILTVALLVATRIAARHADRPALDAGMLLVWIALAVVTSFALPGFSYLFAWPALAASIISSWVPRQRVRWRTLRLVLVAAPTLSLLTPAVDVFFQLAQPRPGNPDSEMTGAVALPLLLALLAIGLVRTAWPRAVSDPASTSGRITHSTGPTCTAGRAQPW